jgi:glycosyltransferase involved in cell wall biosynthesis
MNILISSPSLDTNKNVSGISSVVKEIIKNDGYKFHSLILGKEDINSGWGKWFFQQLILPIKIISNVLRKDINLIHINMPLDNKGILRDSLVLVLGKFLRRKILVHIHGGIYLSKKISNRFIRFLAEWSLNKADCIVVLGDQEEAFLKRNFRLNTSIYIVPNSVDNRPFLRIKNVNHLPLTILYLGRFDTNKGLMEIVEAFNILKDRGEIGCVRFNLCGAGPLREYLLKECKSILGTSFEYFGVVGGDTKIDVINKSDVFILPSKFEGLPMALLETMSAGLVPIVTDVGSISSVVENLNNGLIVNVQDGKDVADKMSVLIKNHQLWKSLSQNARLTVSEKFGIDKFHVRFSEIYNSLQ